MPQDAAERAGAKLDQSESIATKPAELANYDAIIFGAPTWFWNMAAQPRDFLDQTGGLWTDGALADKVGSVVVSIATQPGDQETTMTSLDSTLLPLGMVIVGVPYTWPQLTETGEDIGDYPYSGGALSNTDGSRHPSENELATARFQGEHVTKLPVKLAA